MSNNWKEIWNRRNTDEGIPDPDADEFSVYTWLKKLDGFDTNIANSDAYYRSFYDSALRMWENVRGRIPVKSVYEVGCGSGANLYLLKNRGIRTGGTDYSGSLVETAVQLLGGDCELTEGEAIGITPDGNWDVVMSDGVFAYFPDTAYGGAVLEKMYRKAGRAVIIGEIFDKALEEECISYRREMVKNYDELYRGLDKVFYERDMFAGFAKEHGCEIEFSSVDNEYYWNSRYLFNCILYKKQP